MCSRLSQRSRRETSQISVQSHNISPSATAVRKVFLLRQRCEKRRKEISQVVLSLLNCHVYEFGLETGFTAHLQIATTSNYNIITNLHTLQTTKAHDKLSQFAFTSRFPVTDCKN
jgi:hypothetical protein